MRLFAYSSVDVALCLDSLRYACQFSLILLWISLVRTLIGFGFVFFSKRMTENSWKKKSCMNFSRPNFCEMCPQPNCSALSAFFLFKICYRFVSISDAFVLLRESKISKKCRLISFKIYFNRINLLRI